MKYSDIEDAFLFVSMAPLHEHYAYLNKETGETYYISERKATEEALHRWSKENNLSLEG